MSNADVPAHGSAALRGFDVVVRVARLALESSAEGVEVLERAVSGAVSGAASVYGVEVDLVILPEQVLITERSSGQVGRTAVVRATPGIFRLDRVAALKRLLVGLEQQPPAPDEACRLLDEISRSEPRWPPWIRAVGVALFAAGFAPSVVATWGEAGAAALLGLVMGVLVVATAVVLSRGCCRSSAPSS